MKGYVNVHVDTYETIPLNRIVENLDESEKADLFEKLGGSGETLEKNGFIKYIEKIDTLASNLYDLQLSLSDKHKEILRKITGD